MTEIITWQQGVDYTFRTRNHGNMEADVKQQLLIADISLILQALIIH